MVFLFRCPWGKKAPKQRVHKVVFRTRGSTLTYTGRPGHRLLFSARTLDVLDRGFPRG